jgi:UTP--glucose-1-phosphate uridylyltransferase
MSPSELETVIAAAIAKLPADARQYLEETRFDVRTWAELGASVAAMADGDVRRARRNRVRGNYAWPGAFAAMAQWSRDEVSGYQQRGAALLSTHKVATIVMAGGMATRMNGVVKALMPLNDTVNFLDARLEVERARLRELGAHAPQPALWLMTSLATHDALARFVKDSDRQESVQLFRQDVGVRFRSNGEVWADASGAAGICAAGHGCLIDAVRRSGLLSDFIARGGQYVFVVNVDNIASTLDPAIVGWLASHADAPGLVEVCDRLPTDRGGVVLHNRDTGFDEIVEEFRLPPDFRASDAEVFNTNTFLVRADVLLHAPVAPAWLEIEKRVNDEPVIQFERLIQELTAVVNVLYLRIPREGTATRFLPLKDKGDLAARKDEIVALLKHG